MRTRILLMLAASLAFAGPAIAADTPRPDGQLRVGKTNIFCVQVPCPWRGISSADAEVSPASLLWTRQSLPPLEADEEAARQVELAWYRDQCLVIEGAFEGGRLEVTKIVGDCP